MFGVDVNGLKPGQPAVIDAGHARLARREPARHPAGRLLRAGDAQRLHHGHARGRPHHQGAPRPGGGPELPHRRPAISSPTSRRCASIPKAGGVVKIAFARKNPPIEPPQDTKYVKHIRFRSDILSKWWGTDIYLGAIALLPEGWAEHPNARYPVIYNHGHFPRTFGGFRETPPDPAAPEPQQRQQAARLPFLPGLGVRQDGPRHHRADPAPDAVLRRLVRGELGEQRPVRRRALAGTGAARREGVPRHPRGLGAHDVRRLDRRLGIARVADLLPGPSERHVDVLPRPGGLPLLPDGRHLQGRQRVLPEQRVEEDAGRGRGSAGSTTRRRCRSSTRATTRRCWARRGRSGEQMDIFMAVFGPVGPDGYPKLLYDKWTGVIDRSRGRVLARALRPAPHRRARLEDDRPEAGRQDPHLRRATRTRSCSRRPPSSCRSSSRARRTRTTRAASTSASASRTATRARRSSRASAPSSATSRR